MVGRELCLFLLVDCTQIPARQRPGFIDLAVRRAAPFADPEHDSLWFDGHAAVWLWSRSRVHALLDAAGPGTIRFRAESLYRGDCPAGDLAELLVFEHPDAAADAERGPAFGAEARLWRSGRLVATRWWPQVPDASAWRGFIRGTGGPASDAVPVPLRVSIRPQPLMSRHAATSFHLGLRNWHSAMPATLTAAAVAAAAMLAWASAGVARVDYESRQLETRIARVSKRLEPVISARASADQALAEVRTLLSLRPTASQTRLLAEVRKTIPGSWTMTMWHLPSPDVLEITLRAGQEDVPGIVDALENSPLLQDVTPQSGAGKDELKIQARLTPLAREAP